MTSETPVTIKMTGRWHDSRKALRKFADSKKVVIRIVHRYNIKGHENWFDFNVTGLPKRLRSFQASVRPEWQKAY